MIAAAKVPPHDLDAERALLAAAFYSPAARAAVVNRHETVDFYLEAHRAIFRALLALHAEGRGVDAITLVDALHDAAELDVAGGPAAVAALVDLGVVAVNVEDYSRIVRECATKRALLQLAAHVDAAARDGHPVRSLLDEVQTRATRLRDRLTARDGAPVARFTDHDAADDWDFPPPAFIVDWLLPVSGVVWWGGLPKRFKSLLLLYVALAIACEREQVARHFTIRRRPKILYIAREDGGSRLKARRDDILAAWGARPARDAIRFVVRPALDLLDPAHVAWVRTKCQREGRTLLVLDTWTALSPSADPLGAHDQAKLAAIVVQLAEDIRGAVVAVDHARKNRPDGQPLSAADIFGPMQKWAAAEHIVMLGDTADRRRIEVFIEGKDLEDLQRFLLDVSGMGSRAEKFTYAGSIEQLAQDQKAKGDSNRAAVLEVLRASDTALGVGEIAEVLGKKNVKLSAETVRRHAGALVKANLAQSSGRGKATRYSALDLTPRIPSVANESSTDA